MLTKFLVGAAAASMIAAPVAAAPANPAAKLSVAKQVRASSDGERANDLAGIGIVPALIVAGVAAIGVIAIVNSDDDDDDADSN